MLERAQILAEGDSITLDDLPENLAEFGGGGGSAESGANPQHLREVERRHIVSVLRAEKGNKVHAAKVLGISRRALYRLVRKYHLTGETAD